MIISRTSDTDELEYQVKKGLNKYFYELDTQNINLDKITVCFTGKKIEKEIEEYVNAGYKEVRIEELNFHEAETEQEKYGLKKLRKLCIKNILYGVLAFPGIITAAFFFLCLLIHSLEIFIALVPFVFGIPAFIGLVLSVMFIGNPFIHTEIQKTLILNPNIVGMGSENSKKKRIIYGANVYIPDQKIIVRNVPISTGEGFRAKHNLVLFIFKKKNKKYAAIFG